VLPDKKKGELTDLRPEQSDEVAAFHTAKKQASSTSANANEPQRTPTTLELQNLKLYSPLNRCQMSTVRPMTAMDLFKFNPCNLDHLTETYNVTFYLEYLSKWPHLCRVIEGHNGQIEGYRTV
jgi:hypothetical protein